jgi:hypothetical protein
MTLKVELFTAVILIVTAFAVGRCSVSPPTVKTTEQVNTNTKKDTDDKKVTTITQTPKGQTITTITEDITTKADTDTQTQIQQTVTPPKKNTLNISALGGMQFENSFQPVYGISVTKSIVGPVTAGVFGLNNGIVGLSIGLNF